PGLNRSPGGLKDVAAARPTAPAMFKPSSSHVTIQFILDRSTLDVPPPGWTASSSTRHLTGLLRITVPPKSAPLKVDQILIDFNGITNGQKDVAENGAIGHGTVGPGAAVGSDAAKVDITFVVWQPADSVEFDTGFVAGMYVFLKATEGGAL
ncbi:hypothetical protein HK101_004557, partial [Irineochytrium annulatum]